MEQKVVLALREGKLALTKARLLARESRMQIARIKEASRELQDATDQACRILIKTQTSLISNQEPNKK